MNTIIPQTDPHATYIEHRDEIDRAVQNVLSGGRFILGDEVTCFEKNFSAWCGVNHTVGVNSGTDAIVLALKTLGIGPGDIVITVSHTAVATVAAIEITGATPYLVDIDPLTYTMSPESLSEAVKTILAGNGCIKAVIPVHLYGHPADMDSILKIAGEYGLFVIEDCAQAHGAMYNGKKAGTFGVMSAFSFYPTKNLGAFGDGGALVTNDTRLYEKAKAIREYGWEKRFFSDIPGMNSRLDELQAAILNVKLKYIDNDNTRRGNIAKIYNKMLSKVIIPSSAENTIHVYHQYVVKSDDRDSLKEFLYNKGIMTAVHYPLPVHLQGAYMGRVGTGNLSITESAGKKILSLPMYPQLEHEKIEYICNAIGMYTN